MWQLQDDWSWYTRLSGSLCCLPFSPNMFCCKVKTSSIFKVMYISNLLKMLLKEEHICVWNFITKWGKLLSKQSSDFHNRSQNPLHDKKKDSRVDWIWRPCSFSLTVKVLCIMGVFLEDKQRIKSSTWLFYRVYKKQCKRNNHNFGRNTAGFFTTIKLASTWCSPSRRKIKLQWLHSHPTALITLQQNFSCSRNWKSV